VEVTADPPNFPRGPKRNGRQSVWKKGKEREASSHSTSSAHSHAKKRERTLRGRETNHVSASLFGGKGREEEEAKNGRAARNMRTPPSSSPSLSPSSSALMTARFTTERTKTLPPCPALLLPSLRPLFLPTREASPKIISFRRRRQNRSIRRNGGRWRLPFSHPLRLPLRQALCHTQKRGKSRKRGREGKQVTLERSLSHLCVLHVCVCLLVCGGVYRGLELSVHQGRRWRVVAAVLRRRGVRACARL